MQLLRTYVHDLWLQQLVDWQLMLLLIVNVFCPGVRMYVVPLVGVLQYCIAQILEGKTLANLANCPSFAIFYQTLRMFVNPQLPDKGLLVHVHVDTLTWTLFHP